MQLLAQMIAAAGGGSRIGLQPHEFTFFAVDVGGPQSPAGSMVLESGGTLSTSTASSETIDPVINTAAEWLRGTSGGDWEVRLTKTAGSDTNLGDALNTWLALSSNRSFGQSVTGGSGATRTGTFTAEFRRTGSGTIIKTVTDIIITAEVL